MPAIKPKPVSYTHLIIENYQELKTRLINKGFTFASQTDTEVVAQLLDCGLIVFGYYLAILLRFDGEDSIVPAAVLRAEVIRAMAPMLPYVLVIYMVVFRCV